MIDIERLVSLGCGSRLRVGIGANGKMYSETKSRLSEAGCDISLVRFKEPRSLVSSLKKGSVAAAVRGTVGSGEAMNELRLAFGLNGVMRTAILEDGQGRSFLLTPVGIDEGTDKKSRLALAELSVAYFGVPRRSLLIGVLSKGRLEDVDRGAEIWNSVEDGRMLAKALVERGYRAKHYAILIEDAMLTSDLLIAPDGITGNLIFRSLHFIGGCRAFGAPVVNLGKVFVDTSRAKEDYSDSVMMAAGLALSKRARKP